MNTVRVEGHGYHHEFSSWWDAWVFVRKIWWQIKLDNVEEMLFNKIES